MYPNSPPRRPQDTLPNPEAMPQTEPKSALPQPATPLEKATANAQALEIQVAQATQTLNEMRIKLLKWQGAAEFLASLEHDGDGPGNGADMENPLEPKEPES